METYCHTSAQEARHAAEHGGQDQLDSAWDERRQELAGSLMQGETLHLNGRRLLDVTDLEDEIAEDENVRAALLCCHRDESGAGALLAIAKREAVQRLVTRYEAEFRAELAREGGLTFFGHYSKGAA